MNEPLFQIISCIRPYFYLSIVTTASKRNCLEILRNFNKLELFDLIITHEDVNKIKPDPEGFIKAMTYFKIASANTIIFEDSDAGIEAAKHSGAAVYMVSNFCLKSHNPVLSRSSIFHL